MKMQFETTAQGGIVHLAGRLDIGTKNEFEKQFIAHISEVDKYIAINMEKLDYVDSSGIGALVKCMTECKNNHKDLILYAANEQVMDIFNVAKLAKFFNILSKSDFENKYEISH